MQTDSLSGILQQYDQSCGVYEEFTSKIRELIESILRLNNIHTHSVTSRVKDRESLEYKISKPDSQYKKLSDIKDISGVRIITYFADEVYTIAEIIKNEFEIDYDNSIDKLALLDPDRFGYLSLHYVAKLSPARLKLTEYKHFSDCIVEIQIRSILQHTWAEIEHDSGYKSKVAVPKEVQRRFFQLAGLLELADQQFSQLRDQTLAYKSDVSRLVIENPKAVAIDNVSLSSYIKESSLVRKVDNRIGTITNCKISERQESTGLVNRLHHSGFGTIEDVDLALNQLEDQIIYFVKNIHGRSKKRGQFSSGISLFYLSYVKISSSRSFKTIYQFINNVFSKSASSSIKKSFAKQLVELSRGNTS